jgi:hypothetical protein
VEHAAKSKVGDSHIVQRAVEARDGATVHLLVRSVATVHANHRRLATVQLTVDRWPAPCLTPVGGQPFGVLRMEAMAESMRHDLVGDDALMPCVSKAEDCFRASDRLKESRISHCLLPADRSPARCPAQGSE